MILSALGARDEWEDSYNQFMDELLSGNVILMVGKAFSLNILAKDESTNEFIYKDIPTIGEKEPTVQDYILDILNYNYGTDAQSLNDLSYDERFINQETRNNLNIYGEIRRVIENADFSLSDVNPLLCKLIESGLFKFVITTSFDPLVEIAMKNKWGEGLRIMSVNDNNIDQRDIKDEVDFTHPTLYYLFGSASKKNQKFIATDNDALDMICFWQRSMAGSNLIKCLSEKNLLTLGCDYDDWLFRFIWHLLRKRANNQLERSCVSDFSISANLERYLRQHNVLIQREINVFINRLLAEVRDSEALGRIPQQPIDVFISYSRADLAVAQSLYKKFSEKGFVVWFDLNDLGGRGKKYMDEICRTIDSCKYFVPILSPNLISQKKDFHPYRLEWARAEQQQYGRGVTYARPLCIDGFDLYSGGRDAELPLWMTDVDCWVIKDASSLDDFVASFNE